MWQPTFSPYAPPHNFPQPHLYPPMNPQISTANHRIPMIGDEDENVFPGKIPEQPGLPNIPPTPSSTLPQTGGLDWSLIASTDPETLAKTNDVEALEAIIQSFIKAQFTQTEAQLMPNPLSSKFFRILQISVNYLLDCQAELQNQAQEYHKLAATLQVKAKKLSAALSSAQESQEVFRGKMETTQKCIVCGHRFKNIEYLDAHMQRRHSALMPAWRSLRIGEMQGYGEMMDLISDLRQQIARLQAQIAEQQVRTKEPSSHLSATGVLNAVEERLAEHRKLEKENEERQQKEMKEMIHGLYSSVAQLGDSIRLLSQQPPAMIPQYIPPMQEPTSPKDLEHSLTSTLATLSNPVNRVSFLPIVSQNPIPEPTFPKAWLEQEEKDKKLQEQKEKELQQQEFPDRKGKKPDEKRKDDDQKTDQFELSDTEKSNLQVSSKSASQKESPKKATQEFKRGSDDLIIQRDKTHNDMLKQIDGGQMARRLTQKEEDEELLMRARALLARAVNIDDNPSKAASILSIQKDVLNTVDIKLDNLKRCRSYAPLTVPFVNKQLTRNEAHKINHDRLALMISNKIPIDENYYQDLFKEDQPKFPLVPRIAILQEEEAKKIPKGTVSVHPQSLYENQPKLNDIKKKGAKNLYTRGLGRNIGIPGDSDVSSHVLEDSMFESPSTEPYMEEFERRKNGKPMEHKKLRKSSNHSDTSQASFVSLKESKPNKKKSKDDNIEFIEPQENIVEVNLEDLSVQEESIPGLSKKMKSSNKEEEEEAPIKKIQMSSSSSSDIIDMIQ